MSERQQQKIRKSYRIRTKCVPRGKGKWTWTLTGILTHTNNQTKVVRKYKKEHDGNYT
jgi:hypothetical protein